MKNPLYVIALAVALTLPCSALAQSDAELGELKAQVAELNRRIAELERKNLENRASESETAEAETSKANIGESTAAKSSWTDKISLKGDFRYRFEGIDDEGRDERNRQRMRARFSLAAQVSDNTTVGMELSTGGNNPRSRMQTFDGDSSAKDITLRQAYVRWKPLDEFALTAGKMAQPWARTPVDYFYDSDYSPEGIALQFNAPTGFYGKGYWLQIDERGGDDDTSVLGAEVGYANDLFYASLGYQDFEDAQGFNPCYQGDCNGNTVDANGNLVYDYNITRLRAGMTFAGFNVFGSWARNGDADEDTAYSYGAVYGKASDPGTWSIAASYHDIETDALYGGMIDATFAGGDTASDGFAIKGTYALTRNWNTSFIWYETTADKLGTDRDYSRYQFDLNWKF